MTTSKGKILLTGSRKCEDYNLVARQLIFAIHDLVILGYDKIDVVHGGAMGVDTLGVEFVNKIRPLMLPRGVDIDHDPRYPDYSKHGPKRAPFIRNVEMVDSLSDPTENKIIVAIWDGFSPGTRSTIEYAIKKGFDPRITRF